MRKVKKIIASMLLVTFIATSTPLQVYAQEVNTQSNNTQTEKSETKENKKILEEVKEKREGNIKHFLLEDKTYEAVIYNQPVHYMENGQWKDIDNTLTEGIDEELQNENLQEVNQVNEVDKALEEKTQDNKESTVEKEDKNSASEVDNNDKTKDNTKKEIVSTKNPKEKNILQNTANGFKINIAKTADSKKLVKISKDKYEISWGIQGAQKSTSEVVQRDEKKLNDLIDKSATEEINKNIKFKDKTEQEKNKEKQIIIENEKKKTLNKVTSSVNYTNVYPDIDLNYSIISDIVKENLIINKKVDNNVFTYNIEVKNLMAVKQKDNSVIFYDKNNKSKSVFTIKAPYMFDSAGNESNNIEVKFEETKTGYTLSMIPSKEWLDASDRVYPVTVDPDIITDPSRVNIMDTFVCSKDTANKALNQYLRIGLNSSVGTTQSYLKFNLPTLTSSEMVIGAQLNLYLNEATVSNQINVHKVKSNWTADVNNNLGWNNKPSYNSDIEDYNIVSGSSKWVSWDVTSIAKEWYTSGDNFGLMLKSDNENTTNSVFWSSDMDNTYANLRPQVQLRYVNYSGLEDYWTYHSQDVGRAGTGYINDYNGNLIFVQNDTSMNGNRMPVSISHVYNSNQKDETYNYARMGTGWRLNYSLKLKYLQIGGVDYFKYTDGDGTEHYFKKDAASGIWKDESGMDLTLTLGTNESDPRYFTVKDKKDNKIYFDYHGTLKEISDNNNNIVKFEYIADLPVKITDGAGRVTTLFYEFGYLQSITYPKSATDTVDRVVYFGYENGLLKKVTYPDGKFIQYGYDSNNNLNEVINIDGYKIKYDYSAGYVKRVTKAQEYYNDGTLGQGLDISYGFNTTSFKDSQNRKNILQFNDQGNTILTRDTDGSASYNDYGSNSSKNKMLLNSKMQKSIMNYVTDHNLEHNSSNWYPVHWDGSTGTAGFDNTNPYIGKQSFKINKTNDRSISFMQQPIKLPVGKTYTLSGYIKTENISNLKNGGAAIFLTYQDSNGTWQQVTTNKIVGSNDWARYEATFTIPSNAPSGDVNLKAGIIEETGIAYFDAFQIEEGTVANRYNLVENPNFSLNNSASFQYWGAENVDGSNGIIAIPSTDSIYPSKLDSARFVYNFNGVASKNKNIFQYIKVSGKKGDILVAAGWARAKSIPIRDLRYFALDVGIIRTDGSVQYTVIPFNQDASEWQYASGRAIADSDFKEVVLFGLYYQNANNVQFDGFQLYKEEFGQSYQYDSKGNIISTKDISQKSSQFEYNTNNDLVKSIDPKGNNFKNDYDSKHNLTKATTSENVIYSFTYDSYGNPLTAEVSDSSGINKIKSTSIYDSKGNYIKSLTDSSGNTVNFDYDEFKGTLKSTIDAKGKITSYDYYPSTNQLKTVTKSIEGTNISNSYTYENDKIKTINHNGFNYTFNYDKMGNNSDVYVGNQKLIGNTYENQTGNLLQSLYGNNEKAIFSYDELDRVKAKRYDSDTKDRFNYEYDASGNLGYKYDDINKVSYRYIYDLSDRLVRINDSKGNIINYTYDSNSNLGKLIEKVNGMNYTTAYTYDKDNRLKSISYDRGNLTKSLSDKLVASYTFDNCDASDSSGKGYDGKINGTPSFEATTRGKGIRLNGVDQWIELPDFSTSSSFSISMFLQPELLSNNCFLGKVNQAGDVNHLWFGIWGNGYDVQVNTPEYYAGQPTTSYQHVVATLRKINDTSTEVKFYKDKNLIWSTTLNTVFENTNGKGWAIGQDWDYGSISDLFKGVIDEVSIYNSVLSQEEINELNTSTVSINKNYDALGRLDTTTLNSTPSQVNFTTKYTYEKGKDTGTTTNKVSSIDNYKSLSDANGNSLIKYTYDANGNIETINQGGKVIKYYYNELNELKREDNQVINKTTTYSYDVGGNITNKKEYGYTTAETITTSITSNINYGYTDTNWKDKLMDYNGKDITYDAIGNPLTYDGYTYTWEIGRQLKTISGNNKTLEFKYNDSGIRTEKKVGNVVTSYHLVGDKVTYEETGTDKTYYTYDANGKLVSMNLNGTEYFYIRNAQGDIIGLIDKTGTQVVSYTYDSWGKPFPEVKDINGNVLPTSGITGSLASTVGVKNPYRYRGYRYDTETGLYYLQSRYYNPEWGRFINADALGGSVGELLSHNVFAYCKNNPISMSDEDGFRPIYCVGTDEETEEQRSASLAATKTLTNAINTKTPPPVETGYKPPKNPDKGKKRIPAPGARGETGWLDKKGNVWVPDLDMDGGEGWRRHYEDGSHDHVYPNGKVRSHNSVFMNRPETIVIPIFIIYEFSKKALKPALSY